MSAWEGSWSEKVVCESLMIPVWGRFAWAAWGSLLIFRKHSFIVCCYAYYQPIICTSKPTVSSDYTLSNTKTNRNVLGILRYSSWHDCRNYKQILFPNSHRKSEEMKEALRCRGDFVFRRPVTDQSEDRQGRPGLRLPCSSPGISGM